MKQTIIKVILLAPFLFFQPNYSTNGANEKLSKDQENEPIELYILKLNHDHTNQQIIKVGSEIEMKLFLKDFKDENK